MAQNTIPVVYRPPGAIVLPNNAQWENRFEIHSENSNRCYIIAQNKKKRYWGCSCPGWRRWRTCKHLKQLSLPGYETPHEILLK